MQLKELDSFKISDALYFHTHLNPAIFDGDNMNEEVRQQLLAIAEDFVEHLGISDLDVKDVTISGSNAAYSYTKHSDIDLHIVVDMNQFQDDDVYRELFDAKKTVYNQQHDIYIHDFEVELYVQDANQPHISLGEYSVMFDKWNRLPKKRKANFDQLATKLKYEKIAKLAEFAYKSNNLEKLENVWKTIKKYRQAGLDLNGEFGPENLAFKALRNNGVINKLREKIDELHSEKLSLPEDASGLLNKPTKSVVQLAKLHKVSKEHIQRQLRMGIKVEMEHTGKYEVAKEIALDHLGEDPNYYSKLNRVGLEEKINPEVTKKDFYAEKDIKIEGVGPLKLVATNVTPDIPPQFRIDVITPEGKKIGYFRFVVHDYENEPKYKIFSKFAEKKDPYVLAGNVSVWSEYQKKGIATEVYKWVKSMGNDIKPSSTQTDAGKAMWRGFEKNQTIEEAFDKPYPIKWEKSEHGDYDAMATLPDGKPLTIMFNHESPDEVVITFWRNNNLELTGEGDAQRVFATVLQAIQEFLKIEQPAIISFSASKEVEPGQNMMSRSKLYDRLVKRYAQQWGYNAQSIDYDEGVVFHLTRKKDIAEASGYIPSEKEKKDPRFKTALTVDVKPDSIIKNAEAFGFKVSRAGIPPLLRK